MRKVSFGTFQSQCRLLADHDIGDQSEFSNEASGIWGKQDKSSHKGAPLMALINVPCRVLMHARSLIVWLVGGVRRIKYSSRREGG
jgi:hypothetical protein